MNKKNLIKVIGLMFAVIVVFFTGPQSVKSDIDIREIVLVGEGKKIKAVVNLDNSRVYNFIDENDKTYSLVDPKVVYTDTESYVKVRKQSNLFCLNLSTTHTLFINENDISFTVKLK